MRAGRRDQDAAICSTAPRARRACAAWAYDACSTIRLATASACCTASRLAGGRGTITIGRGIMVWIAPAAASTALRLGVAQVVVAGDLVVVVGPVGPVPVAQGRRRARRVGVPAGTGMVGITVALGNLADTGEDCLEIDRRRSCVFDE